MAEKTTPVNPPVNVSDSSPQLTTFEVFVRNQGGDEQFLSILAKHGFTSKLSLGNLDIDSSEAKELMDELKFGQKCLLRGLTKLCCPEPTNDGDDGASVCKRKRVNYDEVSEMVQRIGARGRTSPLKPKSEIYSTLILAILQNQVHPRVQM